MFGGRFSHTRFSLRDTTELDTSINVFFVETVNSLVSLGQNTPAEHNFRCNIGNETTLTRGIAFTNAFAEKINSTATGRRDYSISTVTFNENISSDVFLSSNISITTMLSEVVNSYIYLGRDVSFRQEYKENMKSNIFLGKDLQIAVNMREAVFAKLNIAIVDKDMFVITISIPANGELRINSENFTVTLNGENIIHLHSGDWINIMRNTIDMIISTGGGSLSGELLYLERYL